YNESNTYVLERFNTAAGNPVKEILIKLNLPDHRSILMDLKVTPTKHGRMTKPYSSPFFIANFFVLGIFKDGDGVKQFQRSFSHSDNQTFFSKWRRVKVRELQERCIIKGFKLSNQERYEHVGPEVTSSQDGKDYKMVKRDYAWLMISRLIAVSISGRGRAPKKVTATNLFYLRRMDEGTAVNVPYLLAQYLFIHAEGRKRRTRLSGRHFVRRLTEHFELVMEEGL
ncbi:hypothetical protein Tco_1422598, partial [Tanacetum coccineum]